MAANFWESTQRRNWIFTKDQLAAMRQKLEDEDPTLVANYPLPEWRHINVYFNSQLARLAKSLSIRQQALATAQMYIKRFYMRVEIRRTNPTLVLVTAAYLACKMEEMPLHIRNVSLEAKKIWPGESPALEIAKIGECEFFIISEMGANLIVHQPYRTFTALQPTFALAPEDQSLASSFINDHYMTDLPLLYAPHTIALAAIMLALVLRLSKTAASAGGGGGGGGQQGQAAQQSSLSMTITSATSMILQQQQSGTRGVASPGAGSGAMSGMMASPSGQQQFMQFQQQQMQQSFNPQQHQQQLQQQQQQQQQQQSKETPSKERQRLAKFSTWLSESSVDIEAMIDCTQELISFYECQEQHSDTVTRDQINRFVKARGL